MVLSEYLAQKYLSAATHSTSDPSDNRPTKKRKKTKHSTIEGTGSLLIADDGDLLLSSKNNNGPEDEADAPQYHDTEVRSAEFRKSKKSAWKSLDSTAIPTPNDRTSTQQGDDDDDADTLLRQTIASQSQSKADLDVENAPTIVDVDPTKPTRSSSGIRPGLQTAADTARLLAEEEATLAREAEQERALSTKRRNKHRSRRSQSLSSDRDPNPPTQASETIYRDATGRIIDLSQRRLEIRRAEAAKIAAEKKAREDAMGEVQLRQRQERKQDLEDAKFLTLGRSVDDDEYNDRLKDVVRWDDPMAAYLARESRSDTAAGPAKGVGATGVAAKVNRRKDYSGPSQPNRYGIKAGWRWDGVDRGNGFEREWFQARGKKARSERLEYEWLVDE